MQSNQDIDQTRVGNNPNLVVEFDSKAPPCIKGDTSVESVLKEQPNQDLLARIVKLENIIPHVLQLISKVAQSVENADAKQSNLENRISLLQTQLVQLPTLISSGMSTCTIAMEKIQAELKLLGEQLNHVKEEQEGVQTQVNTLFKVALQKAISEGHIKVVETEE